MNKIQKEQDKNVNEKVNQKKMSFYYKFQK